MTARDPERQFTDDPHNQASLFAPGETLNFGVPLGANGYGIRDNDGTIQFKNRGGAWGAPGGSSDVSALQASVSTLNTTVALHTLQIGTLSTSVGLLRERLQANRNYFVRTDGNDSNDGLTNSTTGAFLTIQKAVNVVMGLDLNGKDVYIYVGSGTFSEAVILNNLILTGTSILTFLCSETVWSATGSCLTVDGCSGNPVKIIDCTMIATAYGIRVQNRSRLEFSSMDFGACTSGHVYCYGHSIVKAYGDYTISGNAANHLKASYGGIIEINGKTVTMATNPTTFSDCFAKAEWMGQIIVASCTFTNKAYGIGKYYTADRNGIIDTLGAGADALPGDSAGSTSNQGQYI